MAYKSSFAYPGRPKAFTRAQVIEQGRKALSENLSWADQKKKTSVTTGPNDSRARPDRKIIDAQRKKEFRVFAPFSEQTKLLDTALVNAYNASRGRINTTSALLRAAEARLVKGAPKDSAQLKKWRMERQISLENLWVRAQTLMEANKFRGFNVKTEGKKKRTSTRPISGLNTTPANPEEMAKARQSGYCVYANSDLVNFFIMEAKQSTPSHEKLNLILLSIRAVNKNPVSIRKLMKRLAPIAKEVGLI